MERNKVNIKGPTVMKCSLCDWQWHSPKGSVIDRVIDQSEYKHCGQPVIYQETKTL